MKILRSIPFMKYYLAGKGILNDPVFRDGRLRSEKEIQKRPKRTDLINFLLSLKDGRSSYLEIGVRNPDHNFNFIEADDKYCVDPGLEFKEGRADFKMTSDNFFKLLSANEILSSEIRFDLVFIDGLHLAEQVDRDITNSLQFISDNGFIVLHDCNPPTEWHSRESYYFFFTPAGGYWNGTTWKAFLKWRCNPSVYSCCIDTDWGIGLISKNIIIGQSIEPVNSFFEFGEFDKNRTAWLNLISIEQLKSILVKTEE